MAITTEQVKKLRDKTGISVMQCKKALEEADGDVEKALVMLRKQAGAIADKKSDRTLGAGAVQAYIHNTNEVGAIVVLHCETDFVAKNVEFISLAREIAMQVTATTPKFARRENIDEASMKAARAVFEKEVAGLPAGEAGKPADIQEKILEGKLDSYFKDSVLLEQAYIKDPERTIDDLIKEATQKFGERIEIGSFARYAVK